MAIADASDHATHLSPSTTPTKASPEVNGAQLSDDSQSEGHLATESNSPEAREQSLPASEDPQPPPRVPGAYTEIVPPNESVADKELYSLRRVMEKEHGALAPILSLDYFYQYLLPTLRDDESDDIVQELVKTGTLTDNSEWTTYPDLESPRTVSEADFKQFLDRTCEEIIAAGERVLDISRSTTFKISGPAWASETGQCSFKSNFTGVRTKIEGKRPFSIARHLDQQDASNVVFAAAYTLGTNSDEYDPKYGPTPDRYELNAKVLAMASHILYNDPRRKFGYSMTIVGTSIRLGYHSKAISAVSHHFDLIKHPNDFIDFVLAMAFATDEEIGYDPTIKRLPPGEGPNKTDRVQYQITVDGQAFLTLKLLHSYPPSSIVGSSVRVWRVKSLDDDKLYVLKDVWMEIEQRTTEKQIQEEIFSRMGRNGPPPDNFREYFLTIVCDELHPMKRVPDIFNDPREPNFIQPLYGAYYLFQRRPDSFWYGYQSMVGFRSTSIADDWNCRTIGCTSYARTGYSTKCWRRHYSPRQHYRIVYQEYGHSLYGINDMQKLIRYLAQAVTGLQCLYSAGYVHRDISQNNLLVCGDTCKIIDLEYAVDFEDPPDWSSVPKCGTPQFMAVAVQRDRALFERPTKEQENETGKPRRRERDGVRGGSSNEANKPWYSFNERVRHNYLHDLEAIFWIIFYTLLTTAPIGLKVRHAQRIALSRRVRAFFPRSCNGGEERHMIFMASLENYNMCLRSIPPHHESFAEKLYEFKSCLLTVYEAFDLEGDKFRAENRFATAYAPLIKQLEALAEAAPNRIRDLPPVDDSGFGDYSSSDSAVDERRSVGEQPVDEDIGLSNEPQPQVEPLGDKQELESNAAGIKRGHEDGAEDRDAVHVQKKARVNTEDTTPTIT